MNSRTAIALGNVIAGISVALVLIPQSLAYASLAGLPPIHGIYAAILPPIIAAFFVSSPYLQTGPVAITSLLTFGALSTITSPMSEQYIGLCALLALLIGIIRVFIGFVRTGFIAYLMSQPVLVGFSSAAAILIIISQIPILLGVPVIDDNIVYAAVIAVSNPANWSLQTIMLGILTLLIIAGGKKIHPLFPGILAAVVIGGVYSALGLYDGYIIGNLPSELPIISFNLPWANISQLLVPSIVIALVGFAEPAAIARTMAAKNRQLWSVDQEFISQGMANLASGITSGFPVGGSFSRTIINYKAGGRTRWSGAITGLTVLAFLPMISILAHLPRVVLATIVISAVISLIEFKSLYKILCTSRTQGWVAIITFSLTIILSPRIDLAVLIGITLGVAVHLWRERRIEIIEHYKDRTLTLEPVGVLFFGSVPILNESLVAALANHPNATQLILDLRKVGRIDYTGAIALQQIVMDAEGSGLKVKIIPGQPLQGVRIINRVFGADSPQIRDGLSYSIENSKTDENNQSH